MALCALLSLSSGRVVLWSSCTAVDVGELIERLAQAEHARGRAEERAQLTEHAESTMREQLDRERERADRLESELVELRGRGFWARLFGG